MDPVALLQRLRSLAQTILEGDGSDETDWQDVADFASGFMDLNNWIVLGGFNPWDAEAKQGT